MASKRVKITSKTTTKNKSSSKKKINNDNDDDDVQEVVLGHSKSKSKSTDFDSDTDPDADGVALVPDPAKLHPLYRDLSDDHYITRRVMLKKGMSLLDFAREGRCVLRLLSRQWRLLLLLMWRCFFF